jgi:iron(III) transport system permease protein
MGADRLLLVVCVLLLVYLTVVPLIMLVLRSLSSTGRVLEGELTLRHFERVVRDREALGLLLTSVLYAMGTTILAFAIGTAVAWAVERTDVPLCSLWWALALVPLIVPGIVHSIAWIFLLSPEIGWLNAPLRALAGRSLSICTLPGMVWVEGLYSAPLAFVLMATAFRSMDPGLEEAAAASGAKTWPTLRRITLPVLLPAGGSALLILFVRALESFEVPALIGLPGRVYVYTSRVYLSLQQYPPNFGLAAAFAVTLLVLSAAGVGFQRSLIRQAERYRITGRGYRPRRLALGRLRTPVAGLLGLYALLAVGLPFLVLAWSSLLAYYSVPSLEGLSQVTLRNYVSVVQDELTRRAILNSLILGAGSATAVMAVTAVVGWITVRSRLPGRGVLDVLAFAPITIPGIVLGISLPWVYFTLPLHIYGTLWILLVAYVTRFLPYGIRTTTAGLLEIHTELEEGARAAGARWWPAFRRITLPLLWPALLGGGLYVFIISLREFSILLYSSQSVVLAIRIFDLRDARQYPTIAALSVVMIVLPVAMVAMLQKLGGRVASAV